MENQFSQKVSDIIIYSKEEANRLHNGFIGIEHLFLGLLRDGEGKAMDILSKYNINFTEIKVRIENKLRGSIDTTAFLVDDIVLTVDSSKILKMCILEAKLLNNPVADVEHILLAMLKEKNSFVAKVLEENNVSYDSVFGQLSLKTDVNPDINSGMSYDDDSDDDEDEIYRSDETKEEIGNKTQTTSRKTSHDTPTLDKYSLDITSAAEEGKLDPVVGRDKEIERLSQILSRRKKNNPVLIGEPGVGKSAIVEGLALRIVQKKVSRVLFDKRVLSLDMALLVAGTKFRGQFEERLRNIINELRNNPDVIVFIDEIHTIVGVGASAGSMDAANMLKPSLARGEIQCIGATTIDEYRKVIEKDGALERRFQKVIVEPTTPEETLQILKNIKEKYEDHHNVIYTDEALASTVDLTGRYVTDRNFPDKAIDALDEAGARVHLTNVSVPKEIEEQEVLIDEMKVKKNDAVRLQNYELAASYRDQEKECIAKLEQLKEEWEANLKKNKQVVDENQIASVVSMISGVPVQKMLHSEGVKLAGMKDELQAKIIAQDSAIDTLVRAIRRSRVGLKDPNRPIGTFMFLGPTGVGKTQLAKELARYMFGSPDALIRIDMSEYMEKYAVSRLIGASPGYVGYEEGGQLTEKVKRKPYSIVLLDEIEKAHPEVFNILLQIADEGRLTDSFGKTIDFKNTIVIMTSNIGTRQLKDFGRGVGFATQSRLDDKEFSRSVIQKALNKSFAPEFINRIDEIITFDQLTFDAISKIVDVELERLYQRIESIGYKILISDSAKNFLAKKGFDIQYGARPLKRAIQYYLEDGISELIVTSEIKSGDIISADFTEGNDKLTFKINSKIE